MLKTPAEPRVEAGKMQEVRSSFSSMIAASTSSSTAPASGWMKEKGREVEEKEGGVGVQAPNSAELSIDVILTP